MDWFIILAVIFTTAIVLILSLLIVNTVIDTGIFDDNTDATNAIQQSKSTILSLDNMFLFVIIGLSLFVLVSSAFVFNHPAFFIVGFILLCIAVTVAAIVSNTYDTFATSDAITATATQFTKTNFVMDKLPIYIAFMFFATLSVMYISYTQQ